MGENQQPLHGRHALVTGAGSGIGAACVRVLYAAGAKVTLAGRRASVLEDLAKELGGERVFVADGFDVTKPDAIEAGLVKARAALGSIDIVVNNAGEAKSAPFDKTSLEMWEQIIAVDLTGVFNVTKAVLSDIKAYGTGGRIINVASIAGLKGYPYVSAYVAAKHGLIGLTRSLASELAKKGVTVNAVCPGYTETPMSDQTIRTIVELTGRSEEEAMKELTKYNPQGRLVTSEEVADAVLWLALPSAASINGQAIAIAGGEVMVG